jgi:hypothetical protein
MGMMMSETLPLAALLDQIDDIGGDLTIYVADTSQLSSATPALAQREPPNGAPPSGMRYLLEVSLARDAIQVWSDWRSGRTPNSDDKADAVIYYAEHDAYMPTQ